MQDNQGLILAMGLLVCIGCRNDSEDAPKLQETRPGVSATSSPAVAPALPVAAPRRAVDELPQPVTITSEDWPQYRGAHRDGIFQPKGLIRSWPADGPPVVWETAVGPGYAAPAVVAGKVYLNDYDEEQGEWMVRCLALDSGDEQWRYRVKKKIRPNHAITRSAPATDGGFVFALDPKCELHCLDARDGGLIWKKFLPAEYDSLIPPWYNGQCPLIDGDRVVIAPGGRVLMTALEKGTGDAIWETDNAGDFLMSHSSIMPVDIDGVRQYTYMTLKGLVGVDAESGTLLWHFPWAFNTAVATMPLHLGDGKFFLTSGYHAQTVVCQVGREDGHWIADKLKVLPAPTQGWNSEVHTPIVHRSHIYGVGKAKRGLWTCLDFEGNELWTSRRKASFGLGGYLLAGGMFFVLEGKTGTLRVLNAEADEYDEIGSFELLEGPDVWTPPVISQGKLLIRDLRKLICLDIATEQSRVAAAATPPVAQPEP